MDIVFLLIVAAATFGVCFLLDKGFSKLFRSKPQHASGKSVRLNKRYATIGIVVTVLGISALFTGIRQSWFLIIGGGALVILGIGLLIYYLSFGIYYDHDSFVLSTMRKGSTMYYYRQITCQRLYESYGNLLVELTLQDGSTLQLQGSMVGVDAFLETASAGWMQQRGKTAEQCPFYDPANSRWFPNGEE